VKDKLCTGDEVFLTVILSTCFSHFLWTKVRLLYLKLKKISGE